MYGSSHDRPWTTSKSRDAVQIPELMEPIKMARGTRNTNVTEDGGPCMEAERRVGRPTLPWHEPVE